MTTVTNETSVETSPERLLDANTDTAPPIVPFRSSAERFAFIDALRGLAVVLMVQQHLGIWLTPLRQVRGGILPTLMAINALGGAAAPLFVLLAGVGVALGAQPGLSLVRRGLALGLCGYLLNLMTPSWFSPGSFYVLHLIACFWLLAPTLRRLQGSGLLVTFALLLLLSLAVQTWLKTPPNMGNVRLSDTTRPLGAVRLALAEGHFPLLPWLALATLGVWVGRRVRDGRTRSLYALAAVLLGVLVLLRLPVLFLRPALLRALPLRSLVSVSFYPASVAFMLALAGVCVLLVALGRRWDAQALALRNWLVPLGRTSLTLLCLHVVVFREGSLAVGAYHAVTPLAVPLVIAGVLAGWGVIARAWSRIDYRYSLEWWLRLAGGTSSRARG